MDQLKEYTTVRVRQLLQRNREFSGSTSVSRSPQIGDTGFVLESRVVSGHLKYLVESVSPQGLTIWLAEFELEELERA